LAPDEDAEASLIPTVPEYNKHTVVSLLETVPAEYQTPVGNHRRSGCQVRPEAVVSVEAAFSRGADDKPSQL